MRKFRSIHSIPHSLGRFHTWTDQRPTAAGFVWPRDTSAIFVRAVDIAKNFEFEKTDLISQFYGQNPTLFWTLRVRFYLEHHFRSLYPIQKTRLYNRAQCSTISIYYNPVQHRRNIIQPSLPNCFPDVCHLRPTGNGRTSPLFKTVRP